MKKFLSLALVVISLTGCFGGKKSGELPTEKLDQKIDKTTPGQNLSDTTTKEQMADQAFIDAHLEQLNQKGQ